MGSDRRYGVLQDLNINMLRRGFPQACIVHTYILRTALLGLLAIFRQTPAEPERKRSNAALVVLLKSLPFLTQTGFDGGLGVFTTAQMSTLIARD